MHVIEKLEVSNVFALLEGSWELRRSIPNYGNMEGMATFTKGGTDILNYKETGTMELTNRKKFTAYREYQYRYEDGTIAVFFRDNDRAGQLFHVLKFAGEGSEGESTATACHVCKEDIYNAMYYFYGQEDRFNLTYQVKGPLKDYCSNTVFLRMRPSEKIDIMDKKGK